VISVGVYISHSGEAGSPRRDWQRRKTMLLCELLAQATRDGVSNRHFCLSESGSPKRGREEVCACRARLFVWARDFWGFGRQTLLPRREWLA